MLEGAEKRVVVAAVAFPGISLEGLYRAVIDKIS